MLPALPRRRRGETGFTLLELLVVMAILVVLAGLVGSNVLGYLGKSKSQAAQVQAKNVAVALDYYRIDVGGYPNTEQGLAALVKAPPGVPGWNGPYLAQASGLVDPWGNPYLFKVPGSHGEVDVYSLGSDKAEGGTGEARDVGNW